MKVDAAGDIQGRMIRCQKRARLIAHTLEAFAHNEVRNPEPESLAALGQVADELGDELKAIEDLYIERVNRGAR